MPGRSKLPLYLPCAMVFVESQWSVHRKAKETRTIDPEQICEAKNMSDLCNAGRQAAWRAFRILLLVSLCAELPTFAQADVVLDNFDSYTSITFPYGAAGGWATTATLTRVDTAGGEGAARLEFGSSPPGGSRAPAAALSTA